MRDGAPTRKKLERCALILFVNKGFAATTIKDIAQKANIAEGTLYRHYKSKDELAQTLFVRSYEQIALELKAMGEKYSTLEQKMKVMVTFFCEKYDEDPVLFNYLLLAQHHQLKNIDEKSLTAHELLVPLFSDAIRKKEISKKDPSFYAAVVLGIVMQAAISRVYGRISRNMVVDIPDLVEAILGALKIS